MPPFREERSRDSSAMKDASSSTSRLQTVGGGLHNRDVDGVFARGETRAEVDMIRARD